MNSDDVYLIMDACYEIYNAATEDDAIHVDTIRLGQAHRVSVQICMHSSGWGYQYVGIPAQAKGSNLSYERHSRPCNWLHTCSIGVTTK